MRKLVYRFLSKEQRRFIKFCLVGASGVPVNLVFTWLGYRMAFTGLDEGWRKAAAFALGIVLSIFTNFLLNDVWTWRDRPKGERQVLGRLGRFYLVCSAASAVQFGTAMALTLGLRFHYLVAQLFGIALATAVNYVANNLWTFKAKPELLADESRPVAPGPRATAPTPAPASAGKPQP
ncbi:MAG: GtrA family protein [Deltaproteobacteria bacterium]|nr:GtrA family protein [Deltaproteobacteria bacterium]